MRSKTLALLSTAVITGVVSTGFPSSDAEADGALDFCYDFETVDVGGDNETSWFGVNNQDVFVGNFRDPDSGRVEGAIYDDRRGTFEVVATPTDFEFTTLYDINDRGEIVGTFVDFDDFSFHAFRRDRRGRITFLDPVAEGSTVFEANGINNWGTIAGYFQDPDTGDFASYTLRRRADDYEVFSFDPFTAAAGINDWGTVAGSTDDFATADGFTRDRRGRVERFRASETGFTYPFDVNNWGTVVGYALAETGIVGFVKRRFGPPETIDVPGTDDAAFLGINDRGVIAATANGFSRGVIGRTRLCRPGEGDD